MTGDLFELEIYGLVVGPQQPKPLLLLKDKAEGQVFPVGLNAMEAQILAYGSDRADGPHGATLSLLKEMGIQIAKAQFREIKGNRQVLEIHFVSNVTSKRPKVKVIETMAESGISLALAAKAPLFATPIFIEQSRRTPFDVMAGSHLENMLVKSSTDVAH